MASLPVRWTPLVSRALQCVVIAAASSLCPGALRAAPAPQSAEPPADLRAVEAAFVHGQELFARGEFTAAARSWANAEAMMPGTAEHRDNRRVLLENIAVAYGNELRRAPAADLARGVLVVLDAQWQRFVTAHPGEPLPAAMAETRQAARDIVDAADRVVAVAPVPVPPPPPRPWKPLAIAGIAGIASGTAMLAMFVAGAARARAQQHRFDDPENGCALALPEGDCAEIYGSGKRANAAAIAGLILAPVLLGGGITTLIIASRRKTTPRRLVPVFSAHTVGLTLEQRF